MTQESQNPEAPKPPETPSAAWAPRPQPPASPEPPASSSEPPASSSEPPASDEAPADASASAEPVTDTSPPPRVWAPPTLSGTTVGPSSATPAGTSTDDSAAPATAVTDPAVAVPPPEPAPVVERKRGGVPAWLLVIAAIVPAIIVGAIVYFVTSSGDDEDGASDAAAVVEGLLSIGQDPDRTTPYLRELPPDFSTEFPLYEDAEIVVSVATSSEQGTGYLILLSTADPLNDVFAFYSSVLDNEPWQVEIGRSSDDFTGLRFLRPDNIDISGDVSLYRSDLGERTIIFVSYNDVSQAILPGGPTDPFSVGVSRELPIGFPGDVPIYQGAEESVILDTYFERGQGGQAFIVTFLTRDTQDDVIEFYRSEFEEMGWVVSDAGVSSTSFALAIEFDNGPDQSVAGTITADSFEDDPAYTQVDLLVTTSNN